MQPTYTNPVYDRDFPDPFVLKYCGEYWAYCTGIWRDGRCFGIIRSRDLIRWTEHGGAMEQLPDRPTHYRAPEVTYDNGRFYLYYSAGDEVNMRIRVAVADHPGGPFADSGRALTSEQFAVDAHVFEDADGSRHLFYATDFLEHTHVGTGTVRDRMLDPYTLEGRPRPVTRARFDWQVYDPNRAEKGGVRWHTVEGPFVLERKGRFYQMFSGGNWQNPSYGAAYASSPCIDPDDEWEQLCDGERVLPVLRTIPEIVLGPGHNSAVRGPDNRQMYCVYHEWARDLTGRVLAIDPLDWAGDRLIVLGPSHEPCPAPLRPSIEGFGPGWAKGEGRWIAREGRAVQDVAEGPAEARLDVGTSSFLVEVSLRSPTAAGSKGWYGLGLAGEKALLNVQLSADAEEAGVWEYFSVPGAMTWERRGTPLDLPPAFDHGAYHLLRVDCDGRRARVWLDGRKRGEVTLEAEPTSVVLFTRDAAAEFAGVEITRGWEDLFTRASEDPAECGWEVAFGHWSVRDGRLACEGQAQGAVFKGTGYEAYELVVNARLGYSPTARCGVYPAAQEGRPGRALELEQADDGWTLGGLPLPAAFDPTDDHQFRFRKQGGRVSVWWEAVPLGDVAAPEGPTRVGLLAHASEFEMVRVTAIERE